MCASGDVIAEVPPPTPLVAAVALPSATDTEPPATGTTPAPTGASAVLANVQAFYDATTDFKANFKQTYVHPVYGTKTVSKGKLKVKKPGRMVWDYDAKNAPDLYVTKKTLQVVEHDLRQVATRNVDTADFAGADKFLFGGRQLVEDFRVRMASERLVKAYGEDAHTVIELSPKKKNPHYRTLLLVVDDATGRVDSFVVRNTDKSVNRFQLTGITRNGGLSEGEFTFKRPAGYVEVKE